MASWHGLVWCGLRNVIVSLNDAGRSQPCTRSVNDALDNTIHTCRLKPNRPSYDDMCSMVIWYCIMVWYGMMMIWYDGMVWNDCMHGVMVLYITTVWYGVVWYDDMVRYADVVWSD
jgi:hypothetical protein